jgi:hypothetical protein
VPASFDASQSVLKQDSAQRLNPKAARGFQKKRWIRLPRQPEFLRIQSVDTLIDEVIKPCSAQNGGAVLARWMRQRQPRCRLPEACLEAAEGEWFPHRACAS